MGSGPKATDKVRKSQSIERQTTTTTMNAVLFLVFCWHLLTMRETSVPYLHSLVVVLNSLLLLWPLWAAEMTTAKENPARRDNTILVQITKYVHASQPAALNFLP